MQHGTGVIDVARNYRLHPALPYFDRMTRPENDRLATPFDAVAHLATMDRLGISMTGVVANVSARGMDRAGHGQVLDDNHVDLVAEALSVAPDRYFGWVGIDPLGGRRTRDYIRYAVQDLEFRAVHVFPHWFVRPVDDRVYYPIYDLCIELGVPIGLQLGIPGSQSEAKLVGTPTAMEEVLFDFPELTVLCLHLGRPWEREWIALARNYPNFHLVADSPPWTWPEAFTDLFAVDSPYWDPRSRIIWGTNTTDPDASLEAVDGLALDAPTRAAFLGGNARHVFQL